MHIEVQIVHHDPTAQRPPLPWHGGVGGRHPPTAARGVRHRSRPSREPAISLDRPAVPPRAGAAAPDVTRGIFVAFEGGEGAGKSTQVTRLAEWLCSRSCDVVVTHEPGATAVGVRLRALLLDKDTTGLSPRAEALLYAADRAHHVAAVIVPALERGAVVITDRYVDSSLAYQGAGRALPVDEVAELSRWATDGLRPALTVLLDIDPDVGLRRSVEPADRIESESLEFHDRVRRAFLELARQHPHRYLVLDAAADPASVAARIRDRVAELLPAQGARNRSGGQP